MCILCVGHVAYSCRPKIVETFYTLWASLCFLFSKYPVLHDSDLYLKVCCINQKGQ